MSYDELNYQQLDLEQKRLDMQMWMLNNSMRQSMPERDPYNTALDRLFEMLQPPPPPVKGYGGEKDSLMPAMTGIQNQADPFGVIVSHYGRVKTFPKLAAQPFAITAGASSILYTAFDIGIGEYEFDEIKIGAKLISQMSSITIEHRYGTPSDTDLTLYTNDVEIRQVDQPLTYGVARVARTPQECDKFHIELVFDQGLYQVAYYNDQWGRPIPYKTAALVQFYVWITPTTGVSPVEQYLGVYQVAVNSNQSFRWYFEIPVTRGRYDVKVQRATADSSDPNLVNDCSWTVLQSFRNGVPLVAMRDRNGDNVQVARTNMQVYANSENSGALEQYNLIAKRKLKAWNGVSFSSPAFTRNPAWIVYDLLTNQNVLEDIPDSRIDLAKLLEWATYCDLNNLYFDATFEDGSQTTKEQIDLVCDAGHAKFVVQDNKFTVWIDTYATEIAAHFTPHNIVRDSFRFELLTKTKPHFLRCKFLNPDADWQTDERYVYDDGYNDTNSETWEELQLFGVTDKEHVYKQGRRKLAEARLRPFTYTFDTDAEGLLLKCGDVIRLTHPWVALIGLSSVEITAINLNDDEDAIRSIDINASVPMELGVEYECFIVRNTGESYWAEVYSVPGLQNRLSFRNEILLDDLGDDIIEVGNVVAFGSKDKTAINLRVIALSYAEDLTTTVTCVDYAPAIFNANSEPIPPFTTVVDRRATVSPRIEAPVIRNIQSDERVLKLLQNGDLVSRIRIDFAPPETSSITDYRYKWRIHGNDAWDGGAAAPVDGRSIFIDSVQDGIEYDIAIQHMTAIGVASDFTEIAHTVVGKTSKPPAPSNFVVDRVVDDQGRAVSWVLRWFYDASKGLTPPLDLAGYVLKFHNGTNENWTTAYTLAEYLAGLHYDITAYAAGIKTFMLRAIDTSGFESDDMRVLRINFGDVTVKNVLYQTDEHPTFSGTKTNCAVSSGALKANGNGSKWWPAANARWFGDDATTRHWFTGGLWSDASYEFTYRAPSGYNIARGARLLVQIDASGPYFVEYKVPRSNRSFYGDGTRRLYYGASKSVTKFYGVDDTVYIPFPDAGIELRNHTVRLKVTLLGGTTRPQINELSVICDVPDSIVVLDDMPVLAGGSPFDVDELVAVQAISSVVVQDTGTGAFTSLVDKSVFPPTIKLYNSAGVSVDGVIDAVLRGHK